MHLWDFKRAGMQIWDLCMLKMSDTGNHSESYPIPSSYETISLEPTKPWNNDLHNNVTIKKIKLCLKIDLVCRNPTLGMQISKFRYANMDFFKTLRIQIWFLGKDLVFKYEFLVPFIYPCALVMVLEMQNACSLLIQIGLILPICLKLSVQMVCLCLICCKQTICTKNFLQ